jgi:hypothetical protein
MKMNLTKTLVLDNDDVLKVVRAALYQAYGLPDESYISDGNVMHAVMDYSGNKEMDVFRKATKEDRFVYEALDKIQLLKN